VIMPDNFTLPDVEAALTHSAPILDIGLDAA
jgi:hypothetical protein